LESSINITPLSYCSDINRRIHTWIERSVMLVSYIIFFLLFWLIF